eukprot:TRINITY_DN5156_c2_g1_i1.p1 TRINITY_DN5156_c2_g1~~TRINITY_DN5156_c2_g1_i1.p1  ORF type:complete len:300 (-),score=79.64 TRINITY_DN5156_c2_g1_i1:32-931(-)
MSSEAGDYSSGSHIFDADQASDAYAAEVEELERKLQALTRQVQKKAVQKQELQHQNQQAQEEVYAQQREFDRRAELQVQELLHVKELRASSEKMLMQQAQQLQNLQHQHSTAFSGGYSSQGLEVLRSELQNQQAELRAVSSLCNNLSDEVSERKQAETELEAKLERQEKKFQRFSSERRHQEEQDNSVRLCEERLASLTELCSASSSSAVNRRPSQALRTQASDTEEVAANLRGALHELGFDDVARMPVLRAGGSETKPSAAAGTRLLLEASMLDAAARSIQTELRSWREVEDEKAVRS